MTPEYFCIASSIKNVENVREYMRLITANTDLRCSYDWTQVIIDPREVDLAYQQKVITWELDGVSNSDVVIMLPPLGRGAHVELGYALAHDIPVVIVGDIQDPAMAYSLVEQVQDSRELLCYLNNQLTSHWG